MAIPNSILGGVTTFLFTTVAVAGLSIMSKIKYTRRNRFILAMGLSFGMGNLLVPTWATYFLPTTGNRALQGFYNSIQIIIETPFLISAIVTVIGMFIIPYDAEDLVDLQHQRELERVCDIEERHVSSSSDNGKERENSLKEA